MSYKARTKGPPRELSRRATNAWQDDEEAVRRANATRHWAAGVGWLGLALSRLLRAGELFPGYGLSASIWSQDFDKAAIASKSSAPRFPALQANEIANRLKAEHCEFKLSSSCTRDLSTKTSWPGRNSLGEQALRVHSQRSAARPKRRSKPVSSSSTRAAPGSGESTSPALAARVTWESRHRGCAQFTHRMRGKLQKPRSTGADKRNVRMP